MTRCNPKCCVVTGGAHSRMGQMDEQVRVVSSRHCPAVERDKGDLRRLVRHGQHRGGQGEEIKG